MAFTSFSQHLKLNHTASTELLNSQYWQPHGHYWPSQLYVLCYTLTTSIHLSCLESLQVQGGSDISGTLSKLLRCFKKSYFYWFFCYKLSLLFAKTKTKTKGHIPAKTNQQGATRAGIVFGLHAGRTMNETVSYGDFSKNTFYNGKWQFNKCIAYRVFRYR